MRTTISVTSPSVITALIIGSSTINQPLPGCWTCPTSLSLDFVVVRSPFPGWGLLPFFSRSWLVAAATLLLGGGVRGFANCLPISPLPTGVPVRFGIFSLQTRFLTPRAKRGKTLRSYHLLSFTFYHKSPIALFRLCSPLLLPNTANSESYVCYIF